MSTSSEEPTKQVPLDELHRQLGAKMVPFAGYDMPVQYGEGIMAEHLHTRTQASLFDVSHMGQVCVRGDNPDKALEKLVPGDIVSLAQRSSRYTMFTNEQGGIIDDLMITRRSDYISLVVNASRKDVDVAHMRDILGSDYDVEIMDNLTLLALQGPKAAEVMARFSKPAQHMPFMSSTKLHIADIPCFMSRSGYTGEDGYEISVPVNAVNDLARLFLDEPEVKPAGLGARDSLRLEAGLCLYGNDITETTTPIEAGLNWTISGRRREEGGFPGAEIIQQQLREGAPRKRVGILPKGKAPARAHTEITDPNGNTIGEVTSGGFAPTIGGPVAMGYVDLLHSPIGTAVNLVVRGKAMDAEIVSPTFVKHNYFTA